MSPIESVWECLALIIVVVTISSSTTVTNPPTSIQPVQIIAILLGITAVVIAIQGGKHSGKIILAILAVFWTWTGVVYHIAFFSVVNKAAYLFGVLFIGQGILLLYVAYKSPLNFLCHPSAPVIVGALFVTYAMGIYPMLNYVFGHSYPEMPVFGVTPCPVTIFTFGVLLWAKEKVPWYLILIPFLWSLIGVSAAISLGIIEDYGLVAVGLVGSILLIYKR